MSLLAKNRPAARSLTWKKEDTHRTSQTVQSIRSSLRSEERSETEPPFRAFRRCEHHRGTRTLGPCHPDGASAPRSRDSASLVFGRRPAI